MSLFDVSHDSYDNFMGRYSMPLAPKFADFAGVASGMAVVDVGAGTGALTMELVRRGAEVAAAEPSGSFVFALQQRLPEIPVHAAPAEQLPWPDERFDAALAQLVVTFMEDAPAGVQEMRRVVRSGGAVAVCMWDRYGMDMLAAVGRAQAALSSGGPAPEARNLYRDRESLEGLFADGFADVTTDLIEVKSHYTAFDEFWDAAADGAGPSGAWMRSLDGDGLAAARAELYRQLDEPDGPFTLTGRAWAVRATRA
jgi:ubiquinone/menaquinone biosynthesis C-methylase UbiE